MGFRPVESQTRLRLLIFPQNMPQAQYLASSFRASVAPMKAQGTNHQFVGSRVGGELPWWLSW